MDVGLVGAPFAGVGGVFLFCGAILTIRSWSTIIIDGMVDSNVWLVASGYKPLRNTLWAPLDEVRR